jgi:glycosyltransferase involved in cell wall biosynthesis
MTAMRRICIVGDNLDGNLDEGVKKFTIAVAESLRKTHAVSLVSTSGPVRSTQAYVIPAGRTLLNGRLRRFIVSRQPDVILYSSHRSATFFTFIRAFVLKRYYPQAILMLTAFQTRRLNRWQEAIVRLIRPDVVCVQSPQNGDYLRSLGCVVRLVPSGVETSRFRPVDATTRDQLRHKYGFKPHKPVALHVGHLTEGRGIHVLVRIAERMRSQVVLVASTSTPQEERLASELRTAGVRVITDYIPNIEELYQAADCYVFPVQSTNNAIEAPLSVFEALACGLPVVATPFAGLPQFFPDAASHGIHFVNSPDELIRAVEHWSHQPQEVATGRPFPYSWDVVAQQVIEAALHVRPLHANTVAALSD